jgi:hypothetical protein
MIPGSPDAAAWARAEERGAAERGEERSFLLLCGSHGRGGGDLAEAALEATVDLLWSSAAPSGLLPREMGSFLRIVLSY